MNNRMTPQYFRSLPYKRRVEVHEDSDGEVYYVARIEELPSLRIDGDTKEEALMKLDEVFDDFIETMLERGDEIPRPDAWPDRYPGTGSPTADEETDRGETLVSDAQFVTSRISEQWQGEESDRSKFAFG